MKKFTPRSFSEVEPGLPHEAFLAKGGFIPIPIIAAIAALIVTASATIFGQITQEGRPLETVGQTINLTALAGCDATTPNIGLFWNQIPGESDYLVFRVVDGGFQYLNRTTAGVYKDSFLTPGVSYTYQVTAGASGRASNQITVTALTSCSQAGQAQPTPQPTPSPSPQPQPVRPSPSAQPTADTLTIIIPDPLPTGTVGQDYFGESSLTINVFSSQLNRYLASGEATVTVSGSLPPGLTLALHPTAGYYHIDGIPTAAGTYAFTITAKGPSGAFALKSASITIQGQQGGVVLPSPSPTPTPSPTPPPQAQTNNPPQAPTITGPNQGQVGQNLAFKIKAADPNGDRLRYLTCWDKNGDRQVDQSANGECADSGLVDSNQEVPVTVAWPKAGSQLLYAIAFDGKDYGQWSWATVTISSAGGIVPTPTPQPSPTPPPTTNPPGNFSLISPANGATNVFVNPTFDWQDAQVATTYWIYLGQPGQGWYWAYQTAASVVSWGDGRGWQTCPGCPTKDKPQALPAGQWSWWVAAENTAGTTWANLAISQASYTFTVGTDSTTLPNLTIKSFTLAKTQTQPGEVLETNVEIANTGNTPAGNFVLAVSGNAPNENEIKCPHSGYVISNLTGLGANASQKVTLKFTVSANPDLPNPRTARAFVDSHCQVAESNEDDNQATATYTVAGYSLERHPTDFVRLGVNDTSYAIQALLKKDGQVVTNQSDFKYLWTIEDPSVAKITPSAPCTNGIKPPCPQDHLTISPLKSGNTKISVSVTQISQNQKVAEVDFRLVVTDKPIASPSPTPSQTPLPTPQPNGEICGNNIDDNKNGQTDEGCPPLEPKLTQPADGTELKNSDFSFAWNGSFNVDYYLINLISESGNRWWTCRTEKTEVHLKDCQWQAVALGEPFPKEVPDGRYAWKVEAFNKFGTANSKIFNFRIGPPPKTDQLKTPAKPQGPTTGQVGQKLGFYTSVADPNRRLFKFITDLGDGRLVDFSHTALTSTDGTFLFNVTWLEPGQYNIRVKAVDIRHAETDWSEPLTVTITGTAVTCTTLRNSGDPAKKWDITFVPVNYKEGELSKFASDVEQQINGLLFYQPFSQKSSAINFHRVDLAILSDPTYLDTSTTNHYVDWQSFLKISPLCPTDLTVILNNGGGAGTPAQSYGRGAAIIVGSLHGKLIGHEIGHNFGKFAHEDVEGELKIASPNNVSEAPNCSPSADSPPWKGIPGTQIGLAGCIYQNWYKATPCSIMSICGVWYGPERPDSFDPWNIKLLNDKLAIYEGGVPQPTPAPSPGAELKPDLAIANTTILPATPQPGEQVAIVATIENKGNAPAKNFQTAIVDPNAKTCVELSAFNGSSTDQLAAGATVKITFTLNASPKPFETWTMRVYADSTCVVDETDETNNSQWVVFKTSERGPTVSPTFVPGPTSSPGTGGPGPTTNRPPNTPSKPQGRASGTVGEKLGFTTSVSDPDGDRLEILVDTGNGQIVSFTHHVTATDTALIAVAWLNPGIYNLRVKAVDTKNAQSDWSEPLIVIIAGQTTTCTTVHSSGDPAKKLDITFVPAKYNEGQLNLFTADVTRIVNDGLFHYKPFSDKPNTINVHRFDNTATVISDIITRNPEIYRAISSTHPEAIKQITSVCPTDIIVVVVNGPYGGSGGEIIFVYNGSDAPTMFAHELGHRFGGFAEEYDYAEYGSAPFGKPNCSQSKDSPPWLGTPGTFTGLEGCQIPKGWYRPTSDSLMRTLQTRPDAFDPWNIKLLNDKLAIYEGGVPQPTPAPTPTPTPISGTPSPSPTPSPTGSPTTNRPPNTPTKPQGPTTGKAGEVLEFTFTAPNDPDGDPVNLYVDWGDHNALSDLSLRAFNSTNTVKSLHRWLVPGQYQIRAKAVGNLDRKESEWSEPLTITLSGTIISCKTVINNGNPSQKLDITFVPLGYSENELPQFAEEVRKTMDLFFNYTPFSEKRSVINVHLINEVLTRSEIILYPEFMYLMYSICPTDIGVQIINDQNARTAASDVVYISRRDLPNAGFFAHEFGHAFGQLSDEYVSNESIEVSLPSGWLNCSESADNPPWRDFPGTAVGQWKGCNATNWFRPTQNSLMRDAYQTRPDSFDPWNIKLLNDKLGVYE